MVKLLDKYGFELTLDWSCLTFSVHVNELLTALKGSFKVAIILNVYSPESKSFKENTEYYNVFLLKLKKFGRKDPSWRVLE